VILDWSGTLVDDLPAVWASTNEVLRQFALPELSLDQFRVQFRLPFEGFYREFALRVPLAELEACFHRCFRARQHSVVELSHARAFLGFCREQGLRTFVLSTVLDEYYKAQAALSGFAEFIDHAHLGARDKRVEIGRLLSQHALRPDETLFVGDMQHDIEAARHGGVFSCAVLTGYNGLEQLRASEPDMIVEHLGELQAVLERNRLDFAAARRPAGPADAPLPVATVGALILDDAGRMLMVRTRKWSGLWGIPGGKVKYGETLETALRREIKEETDLELDEIRFVLVQDCIESKEFYRPEHFVLMNYAAKRTGTNDVRLNEEAQEYLWVTTAEALKLPLNRPTALLLETWMSRKDA
jgi:ADP-ribose pyrophosphatase YjhB (NUDIX family)/phosphoglycolate phosphatase-like HAD superfamily hydrolase